MLENLRQNRKLDKNFSAEFIVFCSFKALKLIIIKQKSFCNSPLTSEQKDLFSLALIFFSFYWKLCFWGSLFSVVLPACADPPSVGTALPPRFFGFIYISTIQPSVFLNQREKKKQKTENFQETSSHSNTNSAETTLATKRCLTPPSSSSSQRIISINGASDSNRPRPFWMKSLLSN